MPQNVSQRFLAGASLRINTNSPLCEGFFSYREFVMWTKGRQNSGYFKLKLFESKRFKIDCYILKFPEGSEIKPHIDEVDSGNHYRLNIIIKNAISGGLFKCDKTLINTKRIKLFRPDKHLHSVSRVEKGCRYVFSVGWVTDS